MAEGDTAADRVAARIAEGQPVDWDDEIGRVSHDRERRMIGHLRLVEQVARAHRSEASDARALPGESGAPLAGDAPFEQRTIGDYRTLGRLGHGGMSEVLLAENTRLHRRVALKLLPEALTRDPERVLRFQREARAASALNHPNILTIHDFGEEAGQHYIATEVVGGRTLRDLLRDGPLPLGRALDIVAQIADALASAHAAGIVHRDIKPENAMVRPDGYVKVLDFGLAKLTELPASAGEADLQTRTGIVMGTVSYMSPEQARGVAVDLRTDLFSLGVMLYELVTGRRPFEGATRSHVLVAILDSEPRPVADFVPGSPAALQAIVERTLAKDPERRYASAGDLASDLRSLERALEVAGARPSKSRRALRRLTIALGTTVTVLTIAGVALAIHRWRPVEPAVEAPRFDRMRVTKPATMSNVMMSTISMDARYVLYAASGPTGHSLWVAETDGGSALQIVPPAPVVFLSFFIAPDNRTVYFVTFDPRREKSGTMYRVPILGGTPRRIRSGVVGMAPSPDGRLIYSRYPANGESQELVLTRFEGGEETVLDLGGPGRELVHYGWAPQGESYSLVFHARDRGGEYWSAVDRPIGGGPEITTVARRRHAIRQVAWLPGRTGLVMNAEDPSTGTHQLRFVSYPSGAETRITRDAGDYGYFSVSSDGARIVVTQVHRPARIWVAPVDAPGRATPITPGTGEFDSVAWTPKGDLTYTVNLNGEVNIWTMAADGRGARSLTSGTRLNFQQDVSPDGRYLVFLSNRADDLGLWRTDADGGEPVRLARGDAWAPQFTSDGRWVVFGLTLDDRSTVWKVSIDGGEPVRLVAEPSSHPTVSPDGRWLAYQYFDEAERRTRVAVRPFSGGSVVKTFDRSSGYDTVRWTADSRALLYVGGADGGEILAQKLVGGPPKPLLTAPYEKIFAFAVSRNGRFIAYTSGNVMSELLMLSEFR